MSTSNRTFDHLLSIGGASMLLALVLAGIAGVVLAAAVALAVALLAVPGRRPERPGERDPRTRAAPTAPEAVDPWRDWRVAEPDPGYLRRGAA